MNNGYQEFFINNVHYYVHRYVAEQMLGRPLLNTEVVHHIDKDRSNNDPNNLMVFKTTADHSAYHGGVPIKKEGDVWVADYDNFINSQHNICPNCGKQKSSKSLYCKDCYNKYFREVKVKNKPDEETLYELITLYPFTTIASFYGVSDNAVRKWCKSYNLPYRKQDIEMDTLEEFIN